MATKSPAVKKVAAKKPAKKRAVTRAAKSVSETDMQLRLTIRLETDSQKNELAAAAEENRRSINAEVLSRLFKRKKVSE